MRVKLTISYNGRAFSGLQVQKHTKNTVLGIFQDALKNLGIDVKIVASGRTDADVHAFGQVIHFDLPAYWSDTSKLKSRLNEQLPSSIHVRKVESVDEDFHARFSAKKRVYRYILSQNEPNPFEADFVTFVDSLNFKLIEASIKEFEGVYNFELFKKSGSDTTNFVREIFKAFAYQHKDKTILYFEATGYLRSQIRMMVAFLLQISEGRLSIDHLKEQLTCKEHHCKKLAPPNGLYLSKIKY